MAEASIQAEPGPPSRTGLSLFLYPLSHGVLEIYSGMLSIFWPVFSSMFGLSYGAVGTLTMIGRMSGTLPQLVFAPLTDRLGAKWPVVIGLAWIAIGYSTIGLAPSVFVLGVFMLLAPLGSASFHPAAASQLSRILSRRRGLAIALFMIGGTLGASLGPQLGAFLVRQYSIRATVWVIPIGVALAVVMALKLPSGRQEAASRSAAALLLPKSPIPKPIILIVLVSVCQGWLEMCLQSYYPLLMTGRGESLDRAATMLMLYSLFGALGAFVGGTLSDRFQRWKVLAVGVVGTIPLYAGMVLLQGQWLLVIAAALGAVAAMSHPITVAMAQEMMPDRLALASSLCMGISWVIGSLGATFTGVLADQIGMQTALLINTGLPLISLASIFVLRRRGMRRPIEAIGA